MRTRWGWAIVLLALAGCGSSDTSSACDAVSKGLNDYNSKVAGCSGTLPSGSISSSQCQAIQGGGCSSADKQIFNDFGGCLSGLPNCTPATESTFTTQLQSCVDKLDAISAACHP